MTLYERLLEEKDDAYREFQARLVPNVPPETILGVRTPAMRKIAKEVFESPDREAFPCLALCESARGNTGAVINGANEVAVAAFLQGRIGFNDIYRIAREAVETCDLIADPDLEQVFDSDRKAREAARAFLARKGV